MMERKLNNFFVIIISLLVAVMLTITTFPLGPFAPDWIQLFLIYWIIALPLSIGMLSSWIIGLLVDVVMGSTLGIYALAYTLISFIMSNLYKTLRNVTVIQQSIIISIALIIKFTLILWINNLLLIDNYTASIYWTVLTSAFIWPLIFFSLRAVRRKYNLN